MYIYGASGHGKVIASILLANKRNLKGFIDDNPKSSSIIGLPVICTKDKKIEGEHIVIAIGDNRIRKSIAVSLKNKWETVIHTSAIICPTAKIKKGTVVLPNAVVNADAIIGEHCIINTATIIEHDCILEDFIHISPNVTMAGGVKIGEGTHIGIGACVIPNITIGKWVTIGAGTVVINDIPDGVTVVGNPGRIIKRSVLS